MDGSIRPANQILCRWNLQDEMDNPQVTLSSHYRKSLPKFSWSSSYLNFPGWLHKNHITLDQKHKIVKNITSNQRKDPFQAIKNSSIQEKK